MIPTPVNMYQGIPKKEVERRESIYIEAMRSFARTVEIQREFNCSCVSCYRMREVCKIKQKPNILRHWPLHATYSLGEAYTRTLTRIQTNINVLMGIPKEHLGNIP